MQYGGNELFARPHSGCFRAWKASAKLKRAAPARRTRPFLDERLHLLLLACKQSGNRGCLRMRKDKDQSNDECVNTKRLDQSKADQHGNGDLTG